MTAERITRPERGLHFSKFFLHKTVHCLKTENIEYEPYLNAFVLFARAVGFAIEKQYSKCDGYQEWNAATLHKYKDIFSPFTKLRNIIEKEGVVLPKLIHQKAEFGKEGVTGKGDEVVDVTFQNGECIVRKSLGDKILMEKKYPVDYDLVIIENGKNTVVMENFIKESKAYMEVLEIMINESKEKFGGS